LKKRLAVLGSGKGSNFEAIADAAATGTLDAEVILVVSDQPNALILEKAARRGIDARFHDPGNYRTRLAEDREIALAELLVGNAVDWVVLAGWMRVVKAPLLDRFPGRIVNIHPSLLPKYSGLAAWQQALEAGETVTGCTVHFVDAGIDSGRILAQSEVSIFAGDTPESLHARIQEAERILYPAVLQMLCAKN